MRRYRIGTKTDATIFEVLLTRLRRARVRYAERCIHGTYIGTPGGPDYMCGDCEMGWTCGHRAFRFYCATCRRVARREGLMRTVRETYRTFTPIPNMRQFKLVVVSRTTLMWAVSIDRKRHVWIACVRSQQTGRPYVGHIS